MSGTTAIVPDPIPEYLLANCSATLYGTLILFCANFLCIILDMVGAIFEKNCSLDSESSKSTGPPTASMKEPRVSPTRYPPASRKNFKFSANLALTFSTSPNPTLKIFGKLVSKFIIPSLVRASSTPILIKYLFKSLAYIAFVNSLSNPVSNIY